MEIMIGLLTWIAVSFLNDAFWDLIFGDWGER